MKGMKNEQGYALLAVLLTMVLILSAIATFMAGSLNNAKQENTLDTSNKSVAAAEMGVLYYSTDFERALDLIRKEVVAETTIELNKIVACLTSTNVSQCDTLAKRTAWESNIDVKMKELYVRNILIKINELKKITGSKTESFSSTPSNYLPQALALNNIAYTATELSTLSPTLITKIIAAGELNVEMDVVGTANNSPKAISSVFKIKVPISFLNQNTVNTIQQTNIPGTKDIAYTDIYKITSPSRSCSLLLTNLTSIKENAPYECKLSGTEKLSDFITALKIANVTPKLNPKDFWVHVDNFENNVCDRNCNNIDFSSVNVVVKATDVGARNNMNNMVNANLVIDGSLNVDNNLNNLGESLPNTTNQLNQSIVVRELEVINNVQNMKYTNLVVLGTQTGTKGKLKVGGKLDIENRSQLCLDIDRISKTDLDIIASKVDVASGSKIVYYSAIPTNVFVLPNKTIGNTTEDRTSLYVKRENSYTNFLTTCGISVNSPQSISISTPSANETDFKFEVNY